MESGMQNKLIAELYLPVPEPSHVTGRVALESFEFSSDQEVFYKHEGGWKRWVVSYFISFSVNFKDTSTVEFWLYEKFADCNFLLILRKPELS